MLFKVSERLVRWCRSTAEVDEALGGGAGLGPALSAFYNEPGKPAHHGAPWCSCHMNKHLKTLVASRPPKREDRTEIGASTRDLMLRAKQFILEICCCTHCMSVQYVK